VYDLLNHKILFSKLDVYGLRGVAKLWFKSHLSTQKQCIKINYVASTKQISVTYPSALKKIKYGVPQESVLGPILFLLYTNYLPIQATKTVPFASNTKYPYKG
jgi:hypothetical protein